MKRAFLIFTLLLMVFCFGCTKEPDVENPSLKDNNKETVQNAGSAYIGLNGGIPTEEELLNMLVQINNPYRSSSYTYAIPNIVSKKDFKWGDYYPVFTFDVTLEEGKYTYGLFNSQTLNMKDASDSYYLLKEKVGDIDELFTFTTSPLKSDYTDSEFNKEYGISRDTYIHSGDYTIEKLSGSLYSLIDRRGATKKIFFLDTGMCIQQLVSDKFLILTVMGDYNYPTYLYNIENGEMIFLADKAKSPVLSPDGKYLAYTTDHIWINIDRPEEYEKSKGFYILNIETQESIYLPYVISSSIYTENWRHYFYNWVSREDFEENVKEIKDTDIKDDNAKKFFEEYVFLDMDGQNVTQLSIDFPSDFTNAPYNDSDQVSTDEFDWGKYVPFGSYQAGNLTISDVYYDYAIITDETENMEEARLNYKKLNEKFLVKSPIENFYRDNTMLVDNIPKSEFFFNSRITDMSPDADRFLRCLLKDTSGDKNQFKYWYGGGDDFWSVNAEIIDSEGKTVDGKLREGFYDLRDMDEVGDESEDGKFIHYKLFDETGPYSHEINKNRYYATANNCLYIFDLEKRELIYKINLPNETTEVTDKEKLFRRGLYLDKVIDSRYLLFQADEREVDKDGWPAGYCVYAHYLYDLETEKLSFVCRYGEEITLSPDMKYVAYVSLMSSPDYLIDVVENNIQEMEPGFYIRSLESGKVVAFPDTYYWHDVLGWVDCEKIKEIINSDKSYVDPDIKQRTDLYFLPKDSDTVEHTLVLTEDTKKVKVGENAVSVKDFTWGKYVPFLKNRTNGDMNSDISPYARFFLGPQIENIQQGKEVYSKIDSAYKIIENEGKDSYYFESRVVYLSQECDKVGVFSFIEKEDSKYGSVYKVFEGGKEFFSDYQDYADVREENGYYDDTKSEEGFPEISLTYPSDECEEFIYDHSDSKYKLYYSMNREKLLVFSTENKKMLYEVTLPVEEDKQSSLLDFSGGRFILVRVPLENESKKILFDLETGKTTEVQNLGNYNEVSPDGKFVLSISNNYGQDNKSDPLGYYLCNVETNETVYYEDRTVGNTKYYMYGNFVGWVNEEKLMDMIAE